MSERAEQIHSGDLTLEARLHLPEGAGTFPGVVVCHPHPRYGGAMDNNVVMAVCSALTARGIAALRFNFRGVGRSQGSYDEGRGEAADLRAALAHLAALSEVDTARTGLAGYSFGAMMAEQVADGSVRALALIAPPMQAVGADRLKAFTGALLLTAGDSDPVAPAERLRALAAALPQAELHIVDGADHGWWGYEVALEAIVGPFFEQQIGGG
jgi:alpha/beta superfamily hydrolase